MSVFAVIVSYFGVIFIVILGCNGLGVHGLNVLMFVSSLFMGEGHLDVFFVALNFSHFFRLLKVRDIIYLCV